MNQELIVVKKLGKDYEVGRNKVRALAAIDLTIEAGEFVVIYGPSGSGKTTLLSMLAGLEAPTAGTVEIASVNINRLASNAQARFRSDQIGMVFQQFNLVTALNALDNVAMPLLLRGVRSKLVRRQAARLLQQLDLADRAKHKPTELSGGQQQRVAIARALIPEPKILLVDEPTGNLDLPTGREILDLLADVHRDQGTTVILVTHNPDYLRYGDRVLYMLDGKIIKDAKQGRLPTKIQAAPAEVEITPKRGRLSFFEAFRLARIHFSSKGFRAFLTTLGVALGVGSVVALVSLGVGLQVITANQLASFNDLVAINVMTTKNSSLILDDASVARVVALSHVVLASPALMIPSGVTIGGSSSQVMAWGIKPDALSFEGVSLAAGQNYNAEAGVVITKGVAKSFSVSDLNSLVGQKIDLSLIISDGNDLSKTRLVDLPETISGVSTDELSANVYLPLAEMKRVTAIANYHSLKVKVDDRQNVAAVKSTLDDLGYSTSSVLDLISKVDKVFFITQVALGVIGGVALIIALIGIVNIMTVALLERTHEVGVLKAIGATGLDIRRIFEYEVILYGFWGALFGVALAWGLGELVNTVIIAVMRSEGMSGEIQLFVTPVPFATLMVVLTILISLLGGWFPAKKAARLSAMEALRYE